MGYCYREIVHSLSQWCVMLRKYLGRPNTCTSSYFSFHGIFYQTVLADRKRGGICLLFSRRSFSIPISQIHWEGWLSTLKCYQGNRDLETGCKEAMRERKGREERRKRERGEKRKRADRGERRGGWKLECAIILLAKTNCEMNRK